MSWHPKNLRYVTDKPKVEPTIGTGRIVYPATRHAFSGEPESGKTIAAYAIALEEIRSGNLVILADFEMGEDMATERFIEMGATVDDLESLLYVEPDHAPSADEYDNLIYQAETVGTPTLAIFDASAGAYDAADLDDQHRKDVERFARSFVTPLWKRGLSTLVIDHVTKSRESRGRYSIGSERKLGGVDVHLGFERVKTLSRGTDGLMRLVVHKDRRGFLTRPTAADLVLQSDPLTHAITWQFRPPTSETTGDEWRPTGLMEKVSNYLQRQREPVSRSQICRDVKGKREYLLAAIDHLVLEGHAAETAGDRNAKLVAYLHPFPPVPDQFPPVPENGSTDQFPVPPSLEGERERVDQALNSKRAA
jgi:hypothetical protein